MIFIFCLCILFLNTEVIVYKQGETTPKQFIILRYKTKFFPKILFKNGCYLKFILIMVIGNKNLPLKFNENKYS
jgi:hypothetical protein